MVNLKKQSDCDVRGDLEGVEGNSAAKLMTGSSTAIGGASMA